MQLPIRRLFRRGAAGPQAAETVGSCAWVTVRRKRRRKPLSSPLRNSVISRGRPSSPRNV